MPEVDLVLLTSAFPYGSVQEPFLETELSIISSQFRSIYVLPSERIDGPARVLPANARLVEMPWLTDYDSASRRRALMSAGALRVLGWSARAPRDLARHGSNPKLYGDLLARNLLKARDLAGFTRSNGLGSAIFYDYWFENSTLALAYLRARGHIGTAVSRAHGFDVNDHAWGGHPVPFREAKAHGLDRVFPVSDAGAAQLRRAAPSVRNKLTVRRLGTVDPGLVSPEPQTGATPLIVTCARLIPTKRVHLVPQALASMTTPVRWVHIGDGPERERVRAAAGRLLPADTWTLMGGISHQEVLRFYSTNSVQILFSVSETEGVPVSMMEAQSFGIPIVACDVGGVSEIVSAAAGTLVRAAATSQEIAAALDRTLATNLSRAAVQAEFHGRYDAEVNYRGFANELLAVRARTSAAA